MKNGLKIVGIFVCMVLTTNWLLDVGIDMGNDSVRRMLLSHAKLHPNTTLEEFCEGVSKNK